MKRFFYFMALTFFLNSAKSQITKGNWLVGGTGKLYSYNEHYNSYPPPGLNTEWKYTTIELAATVGFFLADKMTLGLRPGVTSIKGHSISGNTIQNAQKYFIGPFARYYLLKNENAYNIVTDICYQYGVSKSVGFSGKVSNFSARCGPVLFLNTSVGVEFLIGYSMQMDDIENMRTGTKKGLDFALGFQIHLEKQ